MKIIVIDDDPTGSQTVHDCLLLLRWDVDTLKKGFQSSSNLFFILANTRALSENQAEERLKEIADALNDVISTQGYNKDELIFISRGDSTLRGHNFLEPYTLSKLLGPFHATFHIPAFIEGKRITKNGNHFVGDLPAHKTIYAQDKNFGFQTNNVGQLLCQKSKNKLEFKKIKNIFHSELAISDVNESNKVSEMVANLTGNTHVVVDALNYSQLKVFSKIIMKYHTQKSFLFRSAASFVSTISNIHKNRKKTSYYSTLCRKNRDNKYMIGLIVIGSYVELTNRQLKKISERDAINLIELDVSEFHQIHKLEDRHIQIDLFKTKLIKEIRNSIDKCFTPILHTSRKYLISGNKSEQRQFSNSLAYFMAQLVAEIKFEIGYLISKGGITTNLILSEGLNADVVYLEGQILPGISLVTHKIPELDIKIPVVTFPGNIGDDYSLVKVLNILEGN